MKKLTTEEFIAKAKKIHIEKYDYSKVEYVNSTTKVCIICPKHGEFWQTPAMHLYGEGCPKCKGDKNGNRHRKTLGNFIEAAKKIHTGKYDYSKVEYINTNTKVCIICPEHGEFWQTPHRHLAGDGCPICRPNKKLTTEEFIKKSRLVHGNKYDYTKSEYVNSRTKVEIICPKHGEFWQTPHSHICGDGCPICRMSHLENEIKMMLDENNIAYEYQKHFKWLGKQSLDFYIPSKNIAIECQGSQHFVPYNFFGGDKNLNETIKRDLKKKNLCETNGVELLYYGKHKGCIKNKKIILNKIIEL